MMTFRTSSTLFRIFVTSMCLPALLGGCTSQQTHDVSSSRLYSLIETIYVGERISIQTSDSRWHRFSVTQVSGDAIYGKKEYFLIDEIVAIKMPPSCGSLFCVRHTYITPKAPH